MNVIIILLAKYLYLLVIVIALLLFWNFKSDRKKIFTLFLISFPLAYLLLILAGQVYYDPRPFVVGHFTPLIAHQPDNGFPSDHMILVSAIAMLFFFYRRRASLWLWFLAIIVGLARVMSGVHHLTDILGSMVIAIVTVWSVNRYLLPLVEKTEIYKKIIAVIIK
jgi:undecaprenyl-diphosphatase